MNSQISLRIAGNKIRKGGFAPIAIVGIPQPSFTTNLLDRPTKFSEKPVFIVTHTPEYALYMAVDSRVRPSDAEGDGRLNVAFTVPANMQLANGASPYTLLRDLYDTFVAKYMTPTSDGRHAFIDTDVDSSIFQSLISQYSLEPRRSGYVTMDSKGPEGTLKLSTDKMTEFFRDTQYKEFAPFKEIQVGTTCATTPSFEALQIPRAVNYKVFINEQDSGNTLTYPTDLEKMYNAMKQPTATMEYTPVSFTLQDLISAGGNLKIDDATITLDPASEQIKCSLKSSQITYGIIPEWDDCPDNVKKLIQSKLKLTLKDNDVSHILSGNQSLPAYMLVNAKFVITTPTIDDYRVSLENKIDQSKRTLTLNISVTKNKTIVNPGKATKTVNQTYSERIQSGKNGVRANVSNNLNDRSTASVANDYPAPKSEKNNTLIPFLIGAAMGLIIGFVAGMWGPSLFASSDPESTTTELANGGIVEDNNSVVANNTDTIAAAEQPVDSPAPAPKKDETTTAGLDAAKDKTTTTQAPKPAEQTQPQVQGQKDSGSNITERDKKGQETLDKAKLRQEILDLVNKKNLRNVKRHKSYNNNGVLSDKDRISIEAVLNIDQYNRQVTSTGERLLKNLKTEVADMSFNSFDDIKAVQARISEIIENHKKK